jgi:CDGSH-type Zn-finger protein
MRSPVSSTTLGECNAIRSWDFAHSDLTLSVSGTDNTNDANQLIDTASRLGELKAMQSELSPGILAETNGPYLVTNGESLLSWLGERIPLRPLTALCRCGQSTTKPFCDGSHAQTNFTDQKDPKRVPDHRDTYFGQQITVLDNRGTCAHSGFCTDKLPAVSASARSLL